MSDEKTGVAAAIKSPSRKEPPLQLTATLRDELIDKARAGYPDEVCGLLVGTQSSSGTRIQRVTQARNLATDRLADRYTLDPDDFMAQDAEARRDGLEVVGIWHTHPDHPARPSVTDQEAAWEGYSYAILSVERDRVAGFTCWRLDGEAFVEQPIEEASS